MDARLEHNLLQYCDYIYNRTWMMFYCLCLGIDAEWGNVGLAKGFIEATYQDLHRLRVLNYLENRSEKHIDLGVLTAHCWQSEEGSLQFLKNGEWISVRAEPYTVLVFPGRSAVNFCSDLVALEHRVVETPTNSDVPQTPRGAIVVFAHAVK